MAWQANFNSGQWKNFTKVWTGSAWAGHWDNAGIVLDPTIFNGGAYVDIEAAFILTPTTVTHLYLKINGVTHTVNIVKTAVTKTESPYIATAFQLDENGGTPPPPYSVQVDEMSVTMYTDDPAAGRSTSSADERGPGVLRD
jgi:hypothetical protein